MDSLKLDITKTCHRCNREKSLNDFGRHSIEIDGLQSICRLCKSEVDKEYRLKTDYDRVNYVSINAKNRRIRYSYQLSWKTYFKKRYGEFPNCEVCQRRLAFDAKGKTYNVHFDHRHSGLEPIKSTPASWYTERPCNDKNIAIFESCDFGILCNLCNNALPTRDRLDWLERAIDYAKNAKTRFIS